MKKLQYNSPVILSFFFLSLLALVLGYLTKGWTTSALFSVYRSSLANPLTYVRFLGHVLGHADGSHFMGNMLLLLVVGPPMEEKYGSRSLLAAIVLTALVSACCTFSCPPTPPCWEPAASCSCSSCWVPSPACGTGRSP